MAKLAELRKKAKDMGIAPAVLRRATTASEMEKVIADHNAHEGTTPRKAVAKKKTGATVAKKKSGPQRKQSRKVSRTASVAKSKSGRKASAPAKSKKGAQAKRPSNSNGSGYVPKGGRNLLDGVDFKQDEGWNARAGSAPDRIIKALVRFKGNRTKVFEFLKDDVWDFVGKKKANGDKRTKAEALAMLRYRISRTAFDFAVRTGQHEPATNRVQYGTGGTGSGVWKPAKKSGAQRASKSAARKTAGKTGRKTATAQKRSQSVRKASAPKRKATARKQSGRKKAGARK